MGASQVLLPDPAGDGVLLLTGPPEETVDDGPLPPWRWDGEAWTAVEPSGPAPSARSFFAATYDPAREVVVLFGGDTAAGASDETWEWDGGAWRGVRRARARRALMSAALAYDPASGDQSCCTAATSTRASLHGETWAWDGLQWGMIAGRGPGADPVAGRDGRRSASVTRWSSTADTRWSTRTLPAALGDTWVWADGRWTAAAERRPARARS